MHRGLRNTWIAVATFCGVLGGVAAPAHAQPNLRPGFWDRLHGKMFPKKQDKEALRFNDELVLANRRVSIAMAEWKEAMVAALQLEAMEDSKEEDRNKAKAEARKQQAALEKAVKEVIADTKKMAVHPSDSGKAFHAAHQEFLAAQQKMIEEDFAAILKIVEDPVPKVSDKLKMIAERLAKVKASEKDHLDKLLKVQQAFGKEHNID